MENYIDYGFITSINSGETTYTYSVEKNNIRGYYISDDSQITSSNWRPVDFTKIRLRNPLFEGAEEYGEDE